MAGGAQDGFDERDPLARVQRGIQVSDISLRDYVESKFQAQEKAVAAALAAQKEAVAAALAAAEKAVAVAEVNAEKWRQNANEWRGAMTDRDRNFLSKSIGYIIGALTIATLAITLLNTLVHH